MSLLPSTIINRWRARLVQNLTGDVLEIGVGSGANLPYYYQARTVQAIEPDGARYRQALKMARHAPAPVALQQAAAEALPYPLHSFDHVVSSLVFCSVADPNLALAEIDRVLRPGGLLHMVEHVHPTNPWLAHIFNEVTPWWRQIARNCHLNRNTVQTLIHHGWELTYYRRWAFVVRVIARRATN
jgi:ubiquinone/menaquinone biosynthesis C-methylase UbiE